MPVLAGDIGGTKTLLRLAEGDDILLERRFDSGRYADFDTLLAAFLDQAAQADCGAIRAACIGVAGPVEGRLARVTNLPWRLDAATLEARFGIPCVRLINDFQAVGYGLETLADDDLLVLQQGQVRPGAPRALIGAGTGLGEGILVWCDGHYEVLASEGGHVDFAPTDVQQRELLAWLGARQPRVSYEQLLSGPGLETLYAFVAAQHADQASHGLAAALERGEGAAAISRAAGEEGDPLAQRTLAMFVDIYGAQAGNLALTCLAGGGVYVAGGIAPRMPGRLSDGRFIAAFLDKGGMRDLLIHYPVYLVMNPAVGLQGAAAVAGRLSR